MTRFPRTSVDPQPAWLEDRLKTAVESASREGLHQLEDAYPTLAAAEVSRAAMDKFGAAGIETARTRAARANDRRAALRATPIAARWGEIVGAASQVFHDRTTHWRLATSVAGVFVWIGLRDPEANARTWAALAVGAAVVVVSAPLVLPALRWLAAFAALTLRTLIDATVRAAAELTAMTAERRVTAEEARAEIRDQWVAAQNAVLLSTYRAQKQVAIHAAGVSAAE